MSTEYYWDPRVACYQPERRTRAGSSNPDQRRKVDAIRVTTEQYDFLKTCLIRREETIGSMYRLTRRLRHLLFGVVLLYVLVVFGGRTAGFGAAFIGLNLSFSATQFSVVMPFLMAYLILYSCRMTANRLRLSHECHIIESALEKFGFPTSYGMTRPYRDWCHKSSPKWQRVKVDSLYQLGQNAYDLLLIVSVGAVLWQSLILALPAYYSEWNARPFAAPALITLLSAAAALCVLAPTALLASRVWKEQMVAQYVAGLLAYQGPPSADICVSPIDVQGNGSSKAAPRILPRSAETAPVAAPTPSPRLPEGSAAEMPSE